MASRKLRTSIAVEQASPNPTEAEPGRPTPPNTVEDDELVAGQPRSIWLTYVKTAEVYDGKLVERWNSDMDVLLVFAGLFTGVVTAFVIAAIGDLGENYAQTTSQLLRLLLAQSTNSTTIGPADIPPVFIQADPSTRVVNICWFLSILCSVSASTGAMLCKLWCTRFRSIYEPAKFPAEYAAMVCSRQKKFDALNQWNVGSVVEFLPGLLHVAVFFFFSGLWKYLQGKDKTVGDVVGAAIVVSAFVYVFITIAPLIMDTPYSTPISTLLLFIAGRVRALNRATREIYQTTLNSLSSSRLLSSVGQLFPRIKPRSETELQVDALIWLIYMPLKLRDVEKALITLLHLVRGKGAVAYLVAQDRLFDWMNGCLQGMARGDDGENGRENGIESGKERLLLSCIRIMVEKKTMAERKIIEEKKIDEEKRIAEKIAEAIVEEKKITEKKTTLSSDCEPSKPFTLDCKLPRGFCRNFGPQCGGKDDQLQLLSFSAQLFPKEVELGRHAYYWANKQLRSTQLTLETLSSLIQGAHRWFLEQPLPPSIPDLAFMEDAALPSIEIVKIILPYYTQILSSSSPDPVEEYTSTTPLSKLICRCISLLRRSKRPRWICKVIIAFSESDDTIDETVMVDVYKWADASQEDPPEIITALLDTIKSGPKLFPTRYCRPLTILARMMEDPKGSSSSAVSLSALKAYGDTLVNAFRPPHNRNFYHLILDILDSFESIKRYFKVQCSGGILSETHDFATALCSLPGALPPPPPIPTPRLSAGLPLSKAFTDSFDSLRNCDLSQPALVYWMCSVIQRALNENGITDDNWIPNAMMADLKAACDQPLEIIRSKVGRIINGAKATTPEQAPPLDTLINLCKSIVDEQLFDINSQVPPSQEGVSLLSDAFQTGVSIVERAVIGGIKLNDVDDLIVILMKILDLGTLNRKQLRHVVYLISILLRCSNASPEEASKRISDYLSMWVGLLTSTEDLEPQYHGIDCELDIKFYCAGILGLVFKEECVESGEMEKLQGILEPLEALAIDQSSSGTTRWKAIYTLCRIFSYSVLEDEFGRWQEVTIDSCVSILEDMQSRMIREEKFADPGWKNLGRITMEKVPKDLFLERSVYDWKQKMPLLWSDTTVSSESGSQSV